MTTKENAKDARAPKTTVVNIRDCPPGWENDPSYVYIGRAGQGHDGYFGNPYRASTLGGGEVGRKEALTRFRHLLKARAGVDYIFKVRVGSLAGKKLVCFCAQYGFKGERLNPGMCHGDIYVEYLDG